MSEFDDYWVKIQKCSRGRLRYDQENRDSVEGLEWLLERGLEDWEQLRRLTREGRCKDGAKDMRIIKRVTTPSGIHICNSSNCHENSEQLALNRRGMSYCTGVALGSFDKEDDDIWRPHSWVEEDGKLIEATPIRRRKYFGICYTREELRKILIRRRDEGL